MPIGDRELLLILATSVLFAAGFVFPLRSFTPSSVRKSFLFHALVAAIVLFEVYFLNRLSLIPVRENSLVIGLSPALSIALCILVLDLLSYFWHRLNHRWAFLWKFHKFHHRATVMDPLMAFRFHPIEVFLGYHLRAGVIWALGFGPEQLSVFLMVFGLSNLFQHSNIRLPAKLENFLSLVIVTPTVHHTHHLKDQSGQNSNFSTVLIFWDKFFATFRKPISPVINDIGLQ